MLPDLATLLQPEHSALLVMECQRGVLEPEQERFRALADVVAQQGTIEQIRKLADAARQANVPVVFLTASRRADRRGSGVNCPLLAAGHHAAPMIPGSARHAMVEALTPQAQDFVVDRMHGVSPFYGTELDALLRNLGIQTVVATGVSVNVGVLGLVIEAVNAGYYVVVPKRAVAGVPPEYVEDVFRYTLRLLARITTVDEVAAVWHSAGSQGRSP